MYHDLRVAPIETMRPIGELVEAIVANMAARQGAARDTSAGKPLRCLRTPPDGFHVPVRLRSSCDNPQGSIGVYYLGEAAITPEDDATIYHSHSSGCDDPVRGGPCPIIPTLWKLVAEGRIGCDLTIPLTMDSRLWLVNDTDP